MSQFEELNVGRLNVDTIIGGGVSPAVRNTYYLDAANGSNGGTGKGPGQAVKTLAQALKLITTLKGDRIVLMGGASALSLAANPAWTYSMTQLVGNSTGMMNQRSRIGMSTTFTPFFTISGYGNTFANLYFMHGTAATDLIGIQLSGSGNRNSFYNCHFLHSALEGYAFKGVYVDAVSETYFNNCFFGGNSASVSSTASLVYFASGNGITIFDDCVFMIRATATTPYFMNVDNNTDDTGLIICRHCMFICEPAGGMSTMAAAFNFQGSHLGRILLDPTCQFYNISHIVPATGQMQYVWMPTLPWAATADELAQIAINSATF